MKVTWTNSVDIFFLEKCKELDFQFNTKLFISVAHFCVWVIFVEGGKNLLGKKIQLILRA